ncbi:MAG TPA: sulfur transferase domain-containing protein [Thermoanaerobaculia bacterium]|nr:sulfur transferase domain-containing protein [Thermoanaerobaculia bacterium]
MMLRWRKALPVLTAAALLVWALAVSAEEVPVGPGFGIPNATQPEDGLLLAGQPTAKQLKALAKAGYKTVIDLRLPEEDHGFDEAKAARKADLEFSSIPVMPEMLDASTVKFFLTVLGNAQRPVLIHCSSGARAAGLYYAWLVLEQGLAEDDALAQSHAAGLSDPGLIGKMQQIVSELKAVRRPKPSAAASGFTRPSLDDRIPTDGGCCPARARRAVVHRGGPGLPRPIRQDR